MMSTNEYMRKYIKARLPNKPESSNKKKTNDSGSISSSFFTKLFRTNLN